MPRWLAWVPALASAACSFSVPAGGALADDAGADDAPTTCTAAGWRDPAWRSRYPLAVQRALVTEIPGKLPVLVTLTSGELVRAKSNGDDLMFTAGDGTTVVPYEIEQFDAATGALRAWVRLDVTDAADTPFFLYFDNPAATAATPPDVWPDYLAVWHFSEDPGGVQGQARDSTVNENHATAQNMVTGDRVDGKIGTAFRFDGVDNGLTLAPFIHPAQFTVEAWIRPAAITGYHTIVDTQANRRWFGIYRSGPNVGVEYYDGGNHVQLTPITLNAWHHVAAAYNNTSLRLYFDGQLLGTTTINLAAQMSPLQIGFSVLGEYFNGAIDELRIRTAGRSQIDIATMYANQRSPDTFVKPGSLESCR